MLQALTTAFGVLLRVKMSGTSWSLETQTGFLLGVEVVLAQEGIDLLYDQWLGHVHAREENEVCNLGAVLDLQGIFAMLIEAAAVEVVGYTVGTNAGDVPEHCV